MAQARLPVRKILEVLRLQAAGLKGRQIAAAIGSALSTVQECLRRAREAGLTWPLPDELNEQALHARLYRRAAPPPTNRRPEPDFAHVHAELARRGVTRLLLWQEYKAEQPEGWQYSVFCDRYQRWLATQELGVPRIRWRHEGCHFHTPGRRQWPSESAGEEFARPTSSSKHIDTSFRLR